MASDVRTRLVPLALGLAAATACKGPDSFSGGILPDDAGPDAGDPGTLPPLDGRDPRLVDAGIDMPDADPTLPDTTPPSLVETTPTSGSSIWLHGTIRLLFDEEIASIAGTTASATVGGTAVSASVKLVAPSTLEVTLDPAARGVGAVALHVSPQVADAAGNAMTDPIDLSLVAPAWHSAPIDRGYVSGMPSIVAASGRVVAAWIVGGSGSHRAAVS